VEGLGGRAELGSVTWRPYLLNPQLPEEGMDLKEFMKIKFGTQDIDAIREKTKNSPLNGFAENVGITFNKERKMVNTVKSHCLAELAHAQGRGDAYTEEIFNAYFIRGEDVGDVNVLCSLAEKIGVTGARACLDSGVYRDHVLTEWQSTQRAGVTSVPYFTIRVASQSPVRFSGAQNPEWFAEMLTKLVKVSEVPMGSRVRINGKAEGEAVGFQESGEFMVRLLDSPAASGSNSNAIVRAPREQLDILWTITPGAAVELHGLKSQELNGRQGEVVSYHPDKGRFEVRLRGEGDGATKALRGDNLHVLQALLPGDQVELHSLSSTALNGQKGEVQTYLPDKGRFEVRLQQQRQVKAIRPENLRRVDG